MIRRDFLKLATVATAGVFVPQFGRWYRQEVPPRLWGDGFHNDAAALQWRLDHAFRHDRRFELSNGIYRIDQTLVIRTGGHINGVVFRGESCAGPLLRVDATARPIHGLVVTNNTLHSLGPRLV